MKKHIKLYTMKTGILRLALMIISSVFFIGVINAQQTDVVMQKQRLMTRNNLSEEQKAMIQSEISKRAEFREAFKATLSQQQKDILTDPTLTQAQRMSAFRSSLSDMQVNISS